MMQPGSRRLTSDVIQSHEDLIVWRKAMDLVFEIYRVTSSFPVAERFGLTAQMRRAAVSIPSNIAEGHGRHHRADYCRFLSIARGSVKELETLLVIAAGLKFATTDQLALARSHCDELSRMLTSLQRKLRPR